MNAVFRISSRTPWDTNRAGQILSAVFICLLHGSAGPAGLQSPRAPHT